MQPAEPPRGPMASTNLAAAPGDPAARSQVAEGLAIVGFGGLVLSIDIPLIRLSESGFWTVLCLRGLMTAFAAMGIWAIDRRLRARRIPLVPGRIGFVVTGIFAAAATTFLLAVFLTSAGNVVFILAFNPMFAAILGWLIAGERPSRVTIAVIPVTIGGVALIIGSGISTGNWVGDLCALATAFFIALALTIARRSRRDFRYCSSLGAIVPALVAVPFMAGTGVESEAFVWLALNGAVVIPVAMICLAAGPLFVPAPIVSLAYLIETVLAPVWIWMLFGERPTDLALLGGLVIIAALIVQAADEMRRR